MRLRCSFKGLSLTAPEQRLPITHRRLALARNNRSLVPVFLSLWLGAVYGGLSLAQIQQQVLKMMELETVSRLYAHCRFSLKGISEQSTFVHLCHHIRFR